MGFKIVAPPGTPAADLEALAERERALATKEAELLALGSDLEAEARQRHSKLDEVREALQRLAQTSVAKDAEAVFEKAMAVVVPPHVVSPMTMQALEQRRKAIAMRELALHAERAAIEARSKRLPPLDGEIDALFAEAAALGRNAEAEASAVAAKAEAEQERVRQQRARSQTKRVEGASAVAQTVVRHAPASPRADAGSRAPAASAAAVINRRASPRVRMQVEVTMQSESNFFTGFTGDISETGVFVATYQQFLPPGTPVELTLALPGELPMPLSGAVRWVRDAGAHAPGEQPGMGIAFVNVGAKETVAIQNFISGREPLFWAD